ncbi:VWA domain-containing protein [Nocardioides sp. C4-1]|uniref:VWA domain-containing protein n=1 Tax=Nocardioides sp. C4-1 TaxID=3151851 RepID=UPI00326491B8
MTALAKGTNAPVPATALIVETRWTPAPGTPEIDASALLLDASGRVRDDADFVFYNQPVHPAGAVRHVGGPAGVQAVEVDLDRVEPAVQRVVLSASADGGTFGQVQGLRLVLLDAATRAEVHSFEMSAGPETAFVSGELYRRDGAWKLRAVGQGYDSGLAGVAGDYGITVGEEEPAADVAPPPPPPPPPPSSTPPPPPSAGPSGVRLTKGEERLPPDLRKRVSLRKEQVRISLAKRGAEDAQARVVLVLDASGSMAQLYAQEVVHRVVERMAAVAAQLDDDGTMQAWTFASHPARLPDLQLGDLPQWLGLHVRIGEFGIRKKKSTRKAKALQPGQVDMRQVGIQNEEQKVIAEVRDFVRAEPIAEPTLVLFFSDGGVYRDDEIEAELRAAVREPIFWQFVGLGDAKFGVLETFDELPGREVDNVGFFAVSDIDTVPDDVLYDRLLSEFPSWMNAARGLGILR